MLKKECYSMFCRSFHRPSNTTINPCTKWCTWYAIKLWSMWAFICRWFEAVSILWYYKWYVI